MALPTIRDIITRSLRKAGILADGRTPTASELTDSLAIYNQMKSSWMGDIIGPRLWDITASAAVTAEVGGRYQVNTTSASVAVTLPASPRDGARIGVIDAVTKFATNSATMLPNGQLLDGVRTTKTLSVDTDGGAWWFNADGRGWIKEVDALVDDTFEFSAVIIEAAVNKLAARLADEFGVPVSDVMKFNANQGHEVIVNRYCWAGRNAARAPTGTNTPNSLQRAAAL